MLKNVDFSLSALTKQRKGSIIRAMERIYLDHAATTPVDGEVLQKMLPYFSEGYGNADSPHGLGRRAMNAVDEARDTIASLLHAKPQEIYFTSGGTESDNWAVFGGARAKAKEGKTHVIVSAIEHHAVLYAAKALEMQGFSVTYLPVNALKEAIREDTGLICIMAANNETGVLQPIQELAEIAHASGALFFTDAVQAAPYMPINVKEWNVDMLSISSHKFYGPKGCGVLYIKESVKAENLLFGGEQERGRRGGTTNVPAVVGMASAYKKNYEEMQSANAKIAALRKIFLNGISMLDGVKINGEEGLPALLNLQIKGVENTALLYKMDLQGVCFAAGSACASASVKPSHVLTAMGLTEEEAKESVRISFGKDNTEEEVLKAAEIFVKTVNELRKF